MNEEIIKDCITLLISEIFTLLILSAPKFWLGCTGRQCSR
jgi:hypothetical protein